VLRVSTLEKRAAEQRARIELHQQELRKLSRRLVQAQEDERSALSRELHDAVGQMLTAAGMDLANLETFRDNPAMFRETLDDARRLNGETLRTVRNLAMGLRPSMLDDLGLGAALEWQGREFSRRSGTPASIEVNGSVDTLPEPYRTCIFRIVQEALTNCARHARAKSVRVSLHGGRERIDLTVQDDGIGFNPASVSGGLGLLGMGERVRELDGNLTVMSAAGRGTILKVEVPLPAGAQTDRRRGA
jgi:signal transduction histidine kinase